MPSITRRRSGAITLAALCSGLVFGPAQAETAYARSAVSQYQQEMAFCKSGQSTQDLATCTREARNARAESRRGGLTSTSGAQVQENAVQRCLPLQGLERSTCMSRMQGGGSTSGRVSGGGLLRESVVVVPAP